MSDPYSQNNPVGTRDKLLKQAQNLLDTGGEQAVTMRAVASLVGVSPMAAYRHFPDKNSLLVVLATENFVFVGDAMDDACDKSASSRENLSAILRAYVSFGIRYPYRYRVMFGREVSEANDKCFTHAAMAVYKRIENAVERCVIQQATVPLVNSYAAVILATVHGAIDLHGQGHINPDKGLGDPEKLVTDLVSILPF
ncbi:TetR/AcrR family transcriptional regulator [Brenneria goodwinii]|uniref:TetR/AcrR family transcriptional regulator n=1 Tax=Brenneria goodwinii TaxID=1109412 RepID=UPI000EF20F2C|nr:TetR/AcrR family transcriptional regulator [Brenneria goodwinii]MCG8155416.1 TetR/AcrR family transcriptional regulator [Brenneria goodwinii]MCG8161616.1 TetR/AcrR family transcriptional regulator [Brenneria goodwinii]MCG8166037.1 TetR/AcrR family transcriptional regulator [Brenneria goodwinii]MCG8169263.1 TetR/AcrR family transcriptional regulator [Brenneria goodwinii]MCG8175733.1 TetR/AcrR family transcriptional regulator [Brenneria goodwinii]